MSAAFRHCVGIVYSGARTPTAGLKGLRVYLAGAESEAPLEVLSLPSPRKYRSRRGVAMWLADPLNEDIPTIVGIDHSFSFPLRYFEVHQLETEWCAFLDDLRAHWPTDEEQCPCCAGRTHRQRPPDASIPSTVSREACAI